MATTKKSVTAKSSADIVDATEVKASKQKQEVDVQALLKQLEAMQKELAEMKEQTSQVSPMAELSSAKEKMITFINLTPGSVMLRGSATRPYEIEGRYNSRTFTEMESKVIVSQMGGYLRDGYVYIDDADFVKEVGLGDAYRSIMTPDALKGLMSKTPEAIISAYDLALDGQKKIILDMIIEKKSKGENIDANILVELGKLSGKDLVGIEAED